MKWLRMRSNFIIIWNDYVWEVITYHMKWLCMRSNFLIIWNDYVWEVIT